MDYKEHHMKQMHSSGSTAYETLIAIVPSSLMTFIAVLLNSMFRTYITKQKKYLFIMEYIFLVLPIILSITILSHYLINILFTLIAVVVTTLALVIYSIKPTKSLVTDEKYKTNFITNARSTINVLSVAAILAVDFKIFPRDFAKTESFGYSLMDVGVGLFMYSNGIVAPEAKERRAPLKKSIKSTLPLFVLGMARLIFVQQTDYNVPVSEYGIHWNFFITLALTKIFCAFVLNVTKIKHIFLSAVFIIVTHEILLHIGLQQFVLSNMKRNNFIAANKEGVVSNLGYVSIYLFSVAFGYSLHKINQVKNKYTGLIFFLYALLALLISLILQNYFGISRKLANSAYCFWILFIGIFMTEIYYLSQMLLEFLYRNRVEGVYSPLIFEAINYNGLVFFLTGNLFTGLINLTFNTLTLTDNFSLIILTSYMFLNCLIVTLLYNKQYKLKI
ncbi:uncharacterized protein At4g17910-like [Anoplophora glabripennis]|uniref:uncharacterized protein At4g17910-like n=1 Tax=Anoplophora glabripennis TaxID=217634 RepID=UPI00087417AB|nr:uncharacterized protein At4g17910-like [Anoplophora glabripennis]